MLKQEPCKNQQKKQQKQQMKHVLHHPAWSTCELLSLYMQIL